MNIDDLKVGMNVKAGHLAPVTGKVIKINKDKNTAVISGNERKLVRYWQNQKKIVKNS